MRELGGFATARETWFKKRIYYREVFCAEKVVKCSALKELELTAVKMLKHEAVKNRVKRFDAEQQASVACL